MGADWGRWVGQAADPEAARRRWRRLAEHPLAGAWLEAAGDVSARGLIATLGGSQAFGELAVANPEWLAAAFLPESLEHGRRVEGLQREAAGALDEALAAADHARALRWLRRFKQREHLRIAARDLARTAPMSEVGLELSNLCDVCTAGVLRVARARTAAELGEPWHLDDRGEWRPSGLAVLGLGRLGAQELGHRRGIKLLFAYAAGGRMFDQPPRPGRAPAPREGTTDGFFRRLAELCCAELAAADPEGALYPVLAPFGDDEPPAAHVRSLAGWEEELARLEDPLELMALLKARPVAGDRAVAAEFLEAAGPLRCPRSVTPEMARRVLTAGRRMARRPFPEAPANDLEASPGGLREIEFLAQAIQFLHGARLPFIQTASTLSALAQISSYRLLAESETRRLSRAYIWLREAENRLDAGGQAAEDRLPADGERRLRLSRLMQADDWQDFVDLHRRYTADVHSVLATAVGGLLALDRRSPGPGGRPRPAAPAAGGHKKRRPPRGRLL